jgi:signal transduction histidine kinase
MAETAASSPTVAALVDRLAAHRTLGGAPRAELEWLAVHGHPERRAVGSIVSTPVEPIVGMYILFSGRVAIYQPRATGRHKIAEWTAGDVTGLLPYSRMVRPPGETIVEEEVDMLTIPSENLREMTGACHEATSILVHVMLDRARFFTSAFLLDEKLKSLGRLAAGLAHELNNPAAAIRRFAKTLPPALDSVEAATQALARVNLRDEELAAVRAANREYRSSGERQVRSPLEEAEREDQVADWLTDRGLDASDAEPIAQSRLTLDDLDRLAASLRADVLAPALRWIAADCGVRELAGEIEQAAARISDLVAAVRGFTRVDASDVAQPVDIAEGLGQTLAVLKSKARDKAVGVTVQLEDGLPPAHGRPAELNQVWSNLIDNALDAVAHGGRVTVSASTHNGFVVVRVADDGPGIAPEISDRIFDPFFTTKDVGKGTGLGLDIVRRIVERHDGDIQVSSAPGRTEFSVSLPVASRTVQQQP